MSFLNSFYVNHFCHKAPVFRSENLAPLLGELARQRLRGFSRKQNLSVIFANARCHLP